tara:strand:- start:594 stop:977 length:384 start_codon:yes stop_codon:yes gene_type:complete
MILKPLINLISKSVLIKKASGHWWAQRLTAIMLLLFGSWFLVSLCTLQDLQYLAVLHWASQPLNSFMLFLFSLSLGYHSTLGLEVVAEDYIHESNKRKILTSFIKKFHLILILIIGISLLKIFLGDA